jgi:Ca-activated chloride channel family protein
MCIGMALDTGTGVTQRAMFSGLGLVGWLLAGSVVPATGQTVPDGGSAAVFRSSVDLVSLSAVVRDQYGRLVRDLSRDDFQVLDGGEPRPVVEFTPGADGPVSLAVLVDTSGSMDLYGSLAAGRAAVSEVLAQLRPGADEIALYAFDGALRTAASFSVDPSVARKALGELDAFGATALYDAVGELALELESRTNRRRALVVVTDGVDTKSARSAADVSGIAAASDVPVYVIDVGPAGPSHPGDGSYVADPATPGAHLENLAYWTGGALLRGRGPEAAGAAAQTLFAELRHGYVLAFESAGPGWRPVEVRLPGHQVRVRTRSAYRSSHPIC